MNSGIPNWTFCVMLPEWMMSAFGKASNRNTGNPFGISKQFICSTILDLTTAWQKRWKLCHAGQFVPDSLNTESEGKNSLDLKKLWNSPIYRSNIFRCPFMNLLVSDTTLFGCSMTLLSTAQCEHRVQCFWIIQPSCNAVMPWTALLSPHWFACTALSLITGVKSHCIDNFDSRMKFHMSH